MDPIPLNHEASAGETNKQVVGSLPDEVVQCLDNSRFLHLATCTDNQPHVSLMSYTYLPSTPYSPTPVIIMTTNASSKKTTNIATNPRVSLLVHDWVSAKRLTTRRPSGGSPPPPQGSIASMLMSMNTAALSTTSATISGTAQLLRSGTEEEEYYKRQHLENNSEVVEEGTSGGGGGEAETPLFITGEEVRVIVVGIRDVRISDSKGGVRDWVFSPERSVNGVH